MNNSFGPWTTAMDSGSGAQLSAFWKKRMKMLPIVRQCSTAATSRARLLLAATTAFTLLLPTPHFSRTVAAVEAESKKSAAADKPFIVRLPGGLVAELIGVGHNPSKGQSWWAADGQPIIAPYEKIDATTQYGADQVGREIALRWIQKPRDVTVRLSPNCSSWYGGCRAVDAEGKVLPGVNVVAGTFLKTQRTCNLNFQIATGPWETLTENSGRGHVTYSEKDHGYAVSQAVEINGATHITISHDVLGRDVRIVAVDNEGREITTEDRGGGDVKGFSQLSVTFYKLPLKSIKAFRVQARHWQKVEVTGIALNPGEMTQPDVKVKTQQDVPKDRSESR